MTDYKISDEDILKIDKLISIPSINERAIYLKKQADFIEKYPSKYSRFIFKLIMMSQTTGVMGYTYRSGTCAICNKGQQIIRFKSGKRKGEINRNKTWYKTMIDFQESFVLIKNSTPYGVCKECRTEGFDEELAKVLSSHEFKFQWNEHISPCPYKKDDKKICYSCKQEMWESEMGRSSTLFGDGSFPSICPHCGVESLLFGQIHRVTTEFRILEKE